MLNRLLTAGASAIAAVVVMLTPAQADDWRDNFSSAFSGSSSGPTASRATRPSRAARADSSSASRRATRVARASRSDDDWTPPRRNARGASRPARSGSGSYEGIASYYWQPQPVASGGRFNPDAMTAAHKTLPFGTRVRVTHLGNGRTVEVVINDRGPYIAGRIIDLSRAAAGVIGMRGQGIARVRVDVIGR